MSPDRRGSVHLFRIAGIGVYLHWSWFGIVALLVLGFRGQLMATYDDLGEGATDSVHHVAHRAKGPELQIRLECRGRSIDCCRIWWKVCSVVCPSNGSRPVIPSYNVTPSE